MTDTQALKPDKDKEHLKNLAMELKDILHQLHFAKNGQYDIWEGNSQRQSKPVIAHRIGGDYDVEYVKGKVTEEDLNTNHYGYQSPDTEQFQQDVWEPGSRGEGSMLGGTKNTATFHMLSSSQDPLSHTPQA